MERESDGPTFRIQAKGMVSLPGKKALTRSNAPYAAFTLLFHVSAEDGGEPTTVSLLSLSRHIPLVAVPLPYAVFFNNGSLSQPVFSHRLADVPSKVGPVAFRHEVGDDYLE